MSNIKGLNMQKKTRKILIITSITLLTIFLSFVSSKTTFNNAEWLSPKDPVEINKRYLYEEFEKGETLVIAIPLHQNFFSQNIFEALKKLTNELKKIPKVKEVQTALEATTIIQSNNEMNIISFGDALEKGYIKTIDDYKERFTKSEYFGTLVSKDLQNLAIVIKLDTPRDDNNYDKRLVLYKEAHNILNKEPIFKHYKFAGESALNYQMDWQSRHDLFILLPIFVVVCVAFLYFIFFNIPKVFLILSIALLTLLTSFSVSVFLGHSMNGVGVSLPILIMIILLSDGVHILARWESLSLTIHDDDKLLKETIKETWFPCLINSITAAVGFGSFYFSNLIPLKHYAVDAVISIFFAYILIQLLMWAGLDLLGHRLDKGLDPAERNRFLIKFVQFFNRASHRMYWRLIVTTIIIAIVGVTVIYKKAYNETNFLDVFFKKNSEIYQSFNFVDAKLNGTGAIDIIFKSTEEEGFKQVTVLNKIAAVEKELRKHHLVNDIKSYLDPIRMIHREFRKNNSELPETNDELAQEITFLEFSRGANKNDVLSPYIDFNYENTVMHIQAPNLNTSLCEELKIFVTNVLKQHNINSPKNNIIQNKTNDLTLENNNDTNQNNSFDIQQILTGSSIYFEAMSKYVLGTQVVSILISLAFVWLCFTLSFGFRLGSIGMIPNLIPICTIYGIIAALNIPFDYATVLIAAVSFGFGVDDSIHFLHNYKENKKKGLHLEANLTKTVHDLGQPIMYTHILFSLAFAVFTLSDMVFLLKLGAFTMLSLCVDLLANLLILPSVMRVLDKEKTIAS